MRTDQADSSAGVEAASPDAGPADSIPGSTRSLVIALLLFVAGLLLVCQGRMPLDPVGLGGRVQLLVVTLLMQGGVAVGWLAAALGWGWAVRRWIADPWSGAALGLMGQLALGTGVMSLVIWLLGWAGQANAAAAWAVGGVGGALLLGQVYVHQSAWQGREVSPRLPGAAVLASGPMGLLIGCCTLAPGALWGRVLWGETEAHGYDVLSYHLQLPKEWIEAGAIRGLEHNVYSFLPGLFEAAYAQLGLWAGGMIEAAQAAQFLHAAMAVVAAGLIGRIVVRLGGGLTGGILAGAAYLAVPWTLVTGSLAYNEQAMLALGAAALAVVLAGARAEEDAAGGSRPVHVSLRQGGIVGLLCGLAVLCKPTALGFLAAPIGLMVLLDRRGWKAQGDEHSGGAQEWFLRCAGFGGALAGVVGLWMLRNGIWMGNPVFPMLCDWFGSGHWTAEQAERWRAAHRPDASLGGALAALWRMGPGHVQFGYLLFPAAAAGAVLGWRDGRWRRPAGLLILMAAAQIVFWLGMTHHQSRFLVPLLLPASVLLGIGVAACPWRRVGVAAAGIVIAACTALDAGAYLTQRNGTAPILIDGTWRFTEPGPADPSQATFTSALNGLPSGSRIYAEAFATPFYVRRPIRYHTVWDASPLGGPLPEAGPGGAAQWLRERGYTHVVVDRGMLQRWLQPGNYGYDPRVRPADLRALAEEGLRPMGRWGGRMLYEVHRRPGGGRTGGGTGRPD